jgi:hypothetical protein
MSAPEKKAQGVQPKEQQKTKDEVGNGPKRSASGGVDLLCSCQLRVAMLNFLLFFCVSESLHQMLVLWQCAGRHQL